MAASIKIKDEAAPMTEDDLYLDHDNDGIAAPYTWLDSHTDSDSDSDNDTPAEEDFNFADADSDCIPTLHDSVEHSFALNQDNHNDQMAESVFYEPDVDMSGVQPPSVMSDMDANSEALNEGEASYLDRANTGSAAAHQRDSSQAPLRTLEDLFNLARHEPVVLQRALMALACTFQVIAAAALWRAVGDRVIVTELVPPLVYASIGAVAYLLGMRYLRIHFAQVRVGDKDWLLCEQVMVAADNGVMLKARFGTAYLIWEQLLGVAQDNDYYYLIIEPSQGFKVPKQGVSDPVLKIKLDDLASLTKAKALQGNYGQA